MSYVVRRVKNSEYDKYRVHLLSLDAANRYLRFGFTVRDEVLNKLCDDWQADQANHILFCIENGNLDFVAVGHIALSDTMELAFSVLMDSQGTGMGNALIKRTIQWCRVNNRLTGCMVCLSHNRAIRHLCNKHGIQVTNSQGESEANIILDSPDMITFVSEVADSNIETFDYLVKRTHLTWAYLPR
jgi:GNAT superfamily N-acetyltransferase